MKIFAVVNLSAESPQSDAFCASPQMAAEKVQYLLGLGADFVDLGARSSFSKSLMIDDLTEQRRLEQFFCLVNRKSRKHLSLDTWSTNTAIKYLNDINILNYTSTQFPEELLIALAQSQVKIIINYLPANNPYSLRSSARVDFNLNLVLDYFHKIIQLLISKGVHILAIDPNLGVWHPSVPNSETAELQQQIIEQIPALKKLAPVFIMAPRTSGALNINLTKLIISQQADFIRTHDLAAVLNLIKT